MTAKQVNESAEYLSGRLGEAPEIGLVLGSGLGPLADELEAPVTVPYGDIPHFRVSTAPGHKGQFVYGQLAGRRVLCMQGRLHGYEGYGTDEIAYPVYVMKKLGLKALVLTNASGGINTDFNAGDLMLIEDHINMTGRSPLTGINDPELGTRFPDMTFAYNPSLCEKAVKAAERCGIVLRKGIYVGTNGPQYETPAEIRAYRILGGDAVGMSTVFEAIAASHCGLPVVAVSIVTNMAAGVLMKPLSEEEVLEIAAERGTEFRRFITEFVKEI